MTDAPVLTVQNLRKQYGTTTAVEELSFAVKKGEIVGLLGPNGAGKTTTINMILGVLEPTRGSISINGLDIAKQRVRAIEQTNFAAVYAPLPGNLSVYQNLRVFGMMYAVKNLSEQIERVLKELDLERFRDTRCGVLSSGEQTRACLAKALLNSPKLLLLDEPTASIDPSSAKDIRAQIKSFVQRDGHGVLWTSHNMYEVEAVCDRVIFLSKGKMLLQGSPKDLLLAHQKANLEELFISVAREPLSLGEGADNAQ